MTKYPQLELDDKDYQVPEFDSELSGEQRSALSYLSDLDKARLSFQLPLPPFEYEPEPEPHPTYDFSENYGIVKYKTSSGVDFSISRKYYQSCPRYNCTLKKTALFTEEEFERQFITGFLDNFEKEYDENMFVVLHSVRWKVRSEVGVQKALKQYLFMGFKKPIKAALEKYKDIFLNDYPEFLIPKGYESRVRGLAVLHHDSNHLYGNGFRSTLYLGVFSLPDLCIGYSYLLDDRLIPVISLSAIGEVKDPTLKIKEVYDCISESIEEGDLNLVLEAKGLVKDHGIFQKTLEDLITNAINLGCQKLILSNGYYFLLIFIDSDFVEEESSDPMVKFKKAKHCLLSAQDPYTKLKIASFMYINRTQGEQQQNFRTRINDELNVQVSKYLRKSSTNERKRTRTPESETESEVDLQSPSHKSSHIAHQEAKQKKLEKSHDKLISKSFDKFDKYRLANFYELEFAKMVKAHVQFHFSLNSLVFLVDCSKISQEIPLKLDPQPPIDVIVKVYDVFWRENLKMTEAHFASEYQRSVNSAEREIRSYIKLKSLQGNVIPKLLGYGTLDDIEPSVGKIHIRPFGPFICVESFEKDDDFTMTRLFLEDKVIPAFQELHKLNILHNAVDPRNIIVTKDKDVKIIDLAHTTFTTDKELFKKEIRNLYLNYEIRLPH